MPAKIYDNEANYQRRYKSLILQNDELSSSNKSLLIDLFNLMRSEGLSFGRRYKYLNHISNLLKWIKKDIFELRKEDLIELVGIVKEKPYTEQTKRDYIITIKKIYKTITVLDKYSNLESLYMWLYDKRNKFFSTTLNRNKIKDKDERFTEEDLMKIIAKANTLRDKCFFSILGTQGTRPQEILTLRIQDISKIDNGIKLKVAGKTGTRDLFIYESFVINHTMNYLKTLAEDKEYVFDFSLKRAGDVLKSLCKESGIKKRAYLYKLRKFAVTRDRILGLSSGAMEQKYGWIRGTRTIAHYDKSISKDYQQEIQQRFSSEPITTPRTKLRDKLCLRCNEENRYDATYCKRCSLKLDMSKEEYEGLNEVDRVMNILMKDDSFKEFIKEKLRNKLLNN